MYDTDSVLTKEQAIEAMKEGKKLTHRLFTEDAYIWMKNGHVYDENNIRMLNFFTIRFMPEWKTDWSIFNSKT